MLHISVFIFVYIYYTINVSTELLKWRPMPDKTREFTLRHNVQRHLGQSDNWII